MNILVSNYLKMEIKTVMMIYKCHQMYLIRWFSPSFSEYDLEEYNYQQRKLAVSYLGYNQRFYSNQFRFGLLVVQCNGTLIFSLKLVGHFWNYGWCGNFWVFSTSDSSLFYFLFKKALVFLWQEFRNMFIWLL